jgi:micrococcal nuclease
MIPAPASRLGFLLLALLPPGLSTAAAEKVTGPIEAEIIRVIDGDTIEVAARIWVGVRVTATVRIRGIDAPELRGRCAIEKALATTARDELIRIAHGPVQLAEVENDKFGGRVVADVKANAGDVGDAMVSGGFARRYSGGERTPWCPG